MRRILIAFLALLFAATAAPRAHAEEDRVSFFHNVSVAEGEEVQNLVCILCSIRNDGDVHQNAVAILGSIRSNGAIDENAVSILGGVNLGQEAHIGGNCVAILGSVSRYTNEQIGQNVVQIPFAILLIPVFILAGIVYLIRSLVWRSRLPYPMPPPPPPPPR
ncbi:MAG TPA: hypothetical protein VE178_16470 [Silvibacterium sp.]|nr:hypothetical protein [Silvibacterium sp.]